VQLGPAEALIRKDNKMIRQLPVFKGYTVDVRLKQFRRIVKQSKFFAGMEYLEFDSDKGDRILTQYIKTLDIHTPEFDEIAQAIV
jgi:hypothetical protein